MPLEGLSGDASGLGEHQAPAGDLALVQLPDTGSTVKPKARRYRTVTRRPSDEQPLGELPKRCRPSGQEPSGGPPKRGRTRVQAKGADEIDPLGFDVLGYVLYRRAQLASSGYVDYLASARQVSGDSEC